MQKALALHFLLAEARREETVPIWRYDGLYRDHAFRGGVETLLNCHCYGVFMDFSSCLRRSLMDKEIAKAENVNLAPPFSLSAIHTVSYTQFVLP